MRHFTKKTILILSALLFAAPLTRAIQKGDSPSAVEAELGKPNGNMNLKGKTTWFYKRGAVTFINDQVDSFEWLTEQEYAKKKTTAEQAIKAERQRPPRKQIATEIIVKRLDLGKNAANCYVIHANNHDGYVIDPGGNPTLLIQYLQAHQINVIGYLLTHAHNDHILAIPTLLSSQYSAPVGLHKADKPLYERRMKNTLPFKPLFTTDRNYGSGALSFKTIHTPGHSPGSVCFYFKRDNLLFSGDTLFKTSVGRTDLDGGSKTSLVKSLNKLASLPDKTIVLPGHGDHSTLGDISRNNPYMNRVKQGLSF